MRSWKLVLAVALVLGVAIWGVGFVGSRDEPTGLGHAAARMPNFAKLNREATAKGEMTPLGTPEFSATFTSSKLSKTLWSTCFPWMNQSSGCTDFGNADEHQWYLPSQVRVTGQTLALEAQQIPTAGFDKNGQPQEYNCRSGMVTTYPGFRFEYGYVQVEAWIPASLGLWPAIWLAAANQQWPPEIDMIESWGIKSESAVFFHPVGAAPAAGHMNPPIGQGWHTFALSWTQSQLTWFVDGKVVLTVHQQIPHQQMYFIANLAEYQPTSTPAYCNGQLLIRSIKVWRL
ncbi:MAG: glycoside hydrolase family 16 protein [Streptosporangiaceae bacterium]